MAALRKALEPGHKRKSLVVVDETPECRKAVHFAARRAQNTGGGLVLLHVIPPAVFQQWKGVEDLMRAEAMEKAEALVGSIADLVRQWSTIEPQQVIREGDITAEVTGLIDRDEDIAVLVLGAGTGKDAPGPLVTAFAGRVAGAFPVPITIVPGNLDEAGIAAIA